jgi:hypothetical protein
VEGLELHVEQELTGLVELVLMVLNTRADHRRFQVQKRDQKIQVVVVVGQSC